MAGPLSDALQAALEDEALWTWALSSYEGHLSNGTAPRFRNQLRDKWASMSGGTILKGNQIDAYIDRLQRAMNVPNVLAQTGDYPNMPDLRVQPFIISPTSYKVRAVARFEADDGSTYVWLPHVSTYTSRPSAARISADLNRWATAEARRLTSGRDTIGGKVWVVDEISVRTVESGGWR